MKFSKIITHEGVFHADEVLAIATFGRFCQADVAIERKFKVSDEEFDDPTILVLDIGRKFQKESNNFDHHQDGDMDATNLLILRHFCTDEALCRKLEKHLFGYVSAVDCGKLPDERKAPTFNSIIRNLNNLEDGFQIAIKMADAILDGYIMTALMAIDGEKRWEKLRKVCDGKVKVDDSKIFIPGWKELAVRDGVLIFATPNERGGFQLISRDSEELRIPVGNGQNFVHNSGFMAVYDTKELALYHAKQIVEDFEAKKPKAIEVQEYEDYCQTI